MRKPTLEKVIVRQACELEELHKKVTRYGSALAEIQSHLICCGGPLNDSQIKYSKEQSKIFFYINAILEEAM